MLKTFTSYVFDLHKIDARTQKLADREVPNECQLRNFSLESVFDKSFNLIT